jgi:uncharacterized OB-fold protein
MMGRTGIVYTETVVHAAPAAFADEAPYQVAIVKLGEDSNVTARILGGRVAIGDAVVEVESLHHAPAFRKS